MRNPIVHVLWIGGFVICNIFLWQEIHSSQVLTISFFDIGQGDASFVETPEGNQILVDGGPDGPLLLEKLGKALPFWDRSIDLLILSHPAQDHVQGLIDVLDTYEVKNIFWSGIKKETVVYKQWKNAIEKEEQEGARIILANAPEAIILGNEDECAKRIEILYPKSIAGTLVKGDDNDTSVVARLKYCETSILFTGDLTSKGEKALLSRRALLDSDILKVAHHGSKTSSSDEFIQAVNPDIAVISAGKRNRYGHPHSQTLETLMRYGITVQRTDQLGDIIFQFK